MRDREAYTFLLYMHPNPGARIPEPQILAINCTSGIPAELTEFNCTYIYRCSVKEEKFRCSETEIFLRDRNGNWSLKQAEAY